MPRVDSAYKNWSTITGKPWGNRGPFPPGPVARSPLFAGRWLRAGGRGGLVSVAQSRAVLTPVRYAAGCHLQSVCSKICDINSLMAHGDSFGAPPCAEANTSAQREYAICTQATCTRSAGRRYATLLHMALLNRSDCPCLRVRVCVCMSRARARVCVCVCVRVCVCVSLCEFLWK